MNFIRTYAHYYIGFLSYMCEKSHNYKKEKTKNKEKSISVMKKEAEVHPKTKAKCPKCGNNEAYYWIVQTRSADEPPTRFYKCTKCKHVWREYS